jgi:hypothetical protein
MSRWYRVALACGLVPLLVGVAIFSLWLITRWQWLMLAGMVTIYGGVALFCIGFVALAVYCWSALRLPDVSGKRLLFSTLGCAATLLSNFAVAAGIIVAAITIETRYTVVVHNASGRPLEHVRVFGGGCDCYIGSIPPSGTTQRSFWVNCDGSLEFSASSGTTTHSQIIEGYVTNGMGGRVVVTIRADEKISVVKDDAKLKQ